MTLCTASLTLPSLWCCTVVHRLYKAVHCCVQLSVAVYSCTGLEYLHTSAHIHVKIHTNYFCKNAHRFMQNQVTKFLFAHEIQIRVMSHNYGAVMIIIITKNMKNVCVFLCNLKEYCIKMHLKHCVMSLHKHNQTILFYTLHT